MHPHHSVRRRASPAISRRPSAAGEEILDYCIEVGGSITGEHGVGMEKNELMGKLFHAARRWT